ncbi:MAG: NAD(P)/FAD-dependent oxidoreductase [Candidatus Woesearchaeota archaeon]
MENNRVYDVLIIGGGPAGMNAAIYAVRSGLDTIMVEKGAFGGQIVDTYEIKNYLGFKSINGAQLAQQMREQVSELGVEILSDSPKNIDLKSDIKSLTTLSGKSIQARTVILSMGAAARKLGLDNEDQLRGKE